LIETLKENPEIYPLDKYRNNNKDDNKAFEKFSLRVAYQVTELEIRVFVCDTPRRILSNIDSFLCLSQAMERTRLNVVDQYFF
jgi:hypothetical protein